MDSSELLDWLALARIPGLGPAAARRALRRVADPGEIAYRLPVAALRELAGIGDAAAERASAARARLRETVESEWRRAERMGVRVVPLASTEYPAEIELLGDAPTVLSLRGEIPPGRTRVAIVGSRRATAYGRRVASRLSAELVARGAEIVSGGARGIDACAHVGALDGGGRTVAVLGSGMARTYPPEHGALYARIAERGAMISEFALDEPPLAEHFPRRNRLISALSAAVVVVEATLRSGSLTTAGHALDQGKEVLAVPGPVSSEQSEGCHRLLRQGAKLVAGADDVVEELSPMYLAALAPGAPGASPGVGGRSRPPLALSEDERAVLRLFDDPEPIHVDRLADVAPFGVARLQTALFGLTLKGAVEPLAGGYYLAALQRPGS